MTESPRTITTEGPVNLRLSRMSVALLVMTLTGVGVAVFTAVLLWLILGQPPLRTDGWNTQAQLDAVRIALLVVGGLGGMVALVVAYRRQRVAEDANNRAAAAEARENSRLFNERFLGACAELGNGAAAVRLAAVYSVARLADDWANERQACINVLCAYLRLPYLADPEDRAGDEEVRLSIVRTIRDRLSEQWPGELSWIGYDLDFTGARIHGGDFSGCRFAAGKVSFERAAFVGGRPTRFDDAVFGGAAVSFEGALFEGQTSFRGSRFESGSVDFGGAAFAGDVSFEDARLDGGALSFRSASFAQGTTSFRRVVLGRADVVFDGATYQAATVVFDESSLAGGRLSFELSRFTGGSLSFRACRFEGASVSFIESSFAGGNLYFDRASFRAGTVAFGKIALSGGGISFGGCSFEGGTVSFHRALLGGGEISFVAARFGSGMVSFSLATFGGSAVSFGKAVWAGGTVDISEPNAYDAPPTFDTGPAPAGLLLPVDE